MSNAAENNKAKTGLILGAIAISAVAVGTGLYLRGQQSDEQAAVEQQAAQEQPAEQEQSVGRAAPSSNEAEAAVGEETAGVQEAETAPTPPTIDEVRVEEDGLTIVAGRAEPGSVISVQVDGEENTTVDVDGSGSFAAITMLDPDENARVLSLVQKKGEIEIASLDEVILAPVIAPVARTEPELDVEVVDASQDPKPETPASENVVSAPTTASEAIGLDGEGESEAAENVEETADVDVAEVEETDQTDAAADVSTGTEQAAELASGESPEFQTDLAELAGVDPAVVDVTNASGAADSKPSLEEPETALAALEPGAADAPNVDTTQADPLPELPVTATTSVANVETPVAPGEQAPASIQNVEQPQPAATQTQTELASEATQDPVPQGTTDTPGRVAVLRSTQEGVELLGRQAVISDNVALDTISYSAEGAVQLAGRANRASEAVRVYLNNKAIVTLEVDPDGRWRGDLPEIDSGVYTLRVDEVSADGAVTSRIQTPFQREDPAVLAAARDLDGSSKRVTVQAGDTLWAISRERYGEGLLFVQVFEANRDSIRDANLIFPGQVFDLPD
ncbi:MAG: LysM peptidoglycan-binding domain-containing protein [Paracoccaceae bacterium]